MNYEITDCLISLGNDFFELHKSKAVLREKEKGKDSQQQLRMNFEKANALQ